MGYPKIQQFLLSQLRLYKIVEIIDGLDIFDRCGIGLKVCSDKTPCPIHHQFKVIKNDIKDILKGKSIAELGLELERGDSTIITIKPQIFKGV